MIAGPVESRAILPVAGVVWRSCLFRPGPAEGLEHVSAEGRVSLTLPGDLHAAVPKRRSEYLAGRLCAALALRALDAPEEVGRKGRAPVWPEGIAGSISHRDGRAMAVASRDLPALGLDCEPLMRAETVAEIGRLLLTDRDRAQRPADWDEARFCTLVFSAKEAAYKALSATLSDIPDFREAQVGQISPSAITVHFRGHRVPVLHTWDGGDCVTLALPGQVSRRLSGAAGG